MTEFATEVLAQHGQVDLLINNAGISFTPTRFTDFSPEQFEKLLNINMWGVYNGILAFLPHLHTRPESSIVNIASLAGLVGLYGYTPYSMSKFAVRGLSEALQSELVGSPVSLLVVFPGGIKTDIIKHAPNLADDQREAAHETFSKSALLTADDAAHKILNAVHKRKSRLVLGKDAKLVNALHTLFPRNFHKLVNTIFSKAMFGSDEKD
jgi:short-subunit dehydrogenase